MRKVVLLSNGALARSLVSNEVKPFFSLTKKRFSALVFRVFLSDSRVKLSTYLRHYSQELEALNLFITYILDYFFSGSFYPATDFYTSLEDWFAFYG